jgi:hypothetical protein
MARTGNFQPLKCQKKQSESQFWQETAKAKPKRGNFWRQIWPYPNKGTFSLIGI